MIRLSGPAELGWAGLNRVRVGGYNRVGVVAGRGSYHG